MSDQITINLDSDSDLESATTGASNSSNLGPDDDGKQVCAKSVFKLAEVDNADSLHLPLHTLIMRNSTNTYLRM